MRDKTDQEKEGLVSAFYRATKSAFIRARAIKKLNNNNNCYILINEFYYNHIGD